MKTVSIIRQRGQLTIPESIRKAVGWAKPLAAVSIAVTRPDEIVIRPQKQQLNWDRVWANIRKSRTITGKGTQSTADILVKDRTVH